MKIRSILRMSALLAALCASAVWTAPSGQEPYIGYVYPAGGQQGTTFQVTIRGQRLRGASEAYVSGGGVSAKVVGYEGAGGPLNKLQQEELKRRLLEIRESRMGNQRRLDRRQDKPAKAGKKASDVADSPRVELPDLPELRNLEQQTASQLKRLADRFVNPQKRPKPPIAEMVKLEITLDANAALGDRELRLETATGLSNPLVFQVGKLPEVREIDKDSDEPGPAALQPPVVLNGQIMPGEVDRFPLQLRGGQKLVIAAQARKLIPYLADAVPGWFQAVISLRDQGGREVAYDDDCGYDPDPALVFTAPHDGAYSLEIRDALYRGREDFVYRVDIADASQENSFLPNGSRGGIELGGAAVDMKEAQAYFLSSGYAMRQVTEVEPNNTGQTCMRATLPSVINGCIDKPGDKDVYGVDGHAGDVVVAEVYARRMGSPLDSLVRLIDTSGHVVAMNDDSKDLESALITQHVDSYVMAKLPRTGRYFVQISDSQSHGGRDYRYSLRLSHPQPNFALRVTPSCLNMRAGRSAVATVYVVRKDGWDGDIAVSLKDPPAGFTIGGGVIPKGRDHVRVTVTAPQYKSGDPISLQIQGSALIDGKAVTRTAVAADDMMQAFAYHHLVPADKLLAMVLPGGRISPKLNLRDNDRLIVPAGGTARVSFSLRVLPGTPLHLELSDPPPGITLQDTKLTPGQCTLVLKADDKHIGYADNLIVEAFTDVATKGKQQKQRVSAGVLPAIPFEIVRR